MVKVLDSRQRTQRVRVFSTRLLAISAAVLVLVLALPAATLAHDHRTVNEYELTVGFNVEPAYIGQINGVFLSVMTEAQHSSEAMQMDVNEHAAIFTSQGLKHDETFTFQVTEMHRGLIIPYHSHLTGEHLGKITVSDDAELSGRVEIRIHENAFHPAEVTVKPGTTLVWTNHDDVLQTVTSGPHPDAEHDHEAAEDSHEHEEMAPVEGLETTLKVLVAAGGSETREFPLRAVFGAPGTYVADFVPTRTGSYIFTVTGTIEGHPINERFESGPGRFDDVQAMTTIQFPEPLLSGTELQEQLEVAKSAASTAQAIAFGGLGAGAVGVIVAGVAILMASRRS
ncbi:MAG: hypothetical protein CL878_11940 [Dehalococcoidia bacterium]|nr:hypothetical protein [Dehalococcoidia bacterium]